MEERGLQEKMEDIKENSTATTPEENVKAEASDNVEEVKTDCQEDMAKDCTDDKEEDLSEDIEENKEEEREDEMKKRRDQKNEVKELKEEVDSLKEKLLRTVAEYDNYRKRTLKEKENIYIDACADVLKEMLPVLDNLERAVVAEGSAEDLKKGVEMTVSQFKGALDKLGVEEICADGEFDPNLHNAVMHVEDENLDKNQVAEVFQKGYKKGDKVLRYSMVKVAN